MKISDYFLALYAKKIEAQAKKTVILSKKCQSRGMLAFRHSMKL